MAEAIAQMKLGEKRPFYGVATVDSGTLTINSATCTLFDSTGAAITSRTGLAVTGSDSAAASVRSWYDLDTTSPTVLTAGWYTLVFYMLCTGSDGLARTLEPAISIELTAVT